MVIVTDSTNSTGIVWRYMSLEKLQHMIRTQSIYLTRLDQFTDPLEGTIPSAIKTRFVRERLPQASNATTFVGEFDRFFGSLRANSYASCWRQSASESSGAWGEYCGLSEGVVVKSSIDRLVATFEGRASIATVQYVSWEAPDLDLDVIWRPFELKHQCFEREQEVRIVRPPDELIALPAGQAAGALLAGCEGPRFLELDVEPDELVVEIRMHPCSSTAFRSRVRKALEGGGQRLTGRLRESELPRFGPQSETAMSQSARPG